MQKNSLFSLPLTLHIPPVQGHPLTLLHSHLHGDPHSYTRLHFPLFWGPLQVMDPYISSTSPSIGLESPDICMAWRCSCSMKTSAVGSGFACGV